MAKVVVWCEECTLFNVVSDIRECQEWIDTINFVAASYSAPCQFDVTEQKRFQRPLLPACCTTLNLVMWLLAKVSSLGKVIDSCVIINHIK